MKRMLTILLLVSMIASLAIMTTADLAIKWEVEYYPEYRKGGACDAFEGNALYAGGANSSWLTSDPNVFSWTPGGTNWTTLPDMTGIRYAVDGVTINGVFYVCGGRYDGDPDHMTNTSYKLYRNGQNQLEWGSLGYNMSAALGHYAMAKVGTKIVIAGGSLSSHPRPRQGDTSTDDTENTVQYFDTSYPSNGWNTYTSISGHSRAWCAGAGIGNYFYLFGGAWTEYNSGTFSIIRTNEAKKLNTSNNTWTSLANLPVARSGMDAAVYDDRFVILVGGTLQGVDYSQGSGVRWYEDDVYVYDTQENEWNTLCYGMPMPTNDIRTTIIGNKIYAINGENIDSDHSNTDYHLRVGTITFPSTTFLDCSGNMDRSYDKNCPTWTTTAFFFNPEDSWEWTFNSGSNNIKPIGVGDITGDGYDDVVVITSGGEIKCIAMGYTGAIDLLDLGNPSVAWGWSFSSDVNDIVPLGVGDYDADGYADIYVIERDGDVRVMTTNGSQIAGLYDLGNPKTAWTWGFSSDPDEWQYNAIGIGDYNRDHKDDVWVLDNNGLVRVLTVTGDHDNTGNLNGPYDVGTPSSSYFKADYRSSNCMRPIKVCDVNGDGFCDVVTVNDAGDVAAYTVNGNGTFDQSSTSMTDPYSDNRLQADQTSTKPLDIAYGWDWWWN